MLAAAVLSLAGCTTPDHTGGTWEYRVIEGWARPQERAEFEKQLNDAGKQGFAVVSATTLPGDANNAPKTTVILKRRKP